MKKVLIPTKLESVARQLLEKHGGYQVIQDDKTDLAELARQNPDCHALIVRSEKITPAVINLMPALKVIVRAGSGYDTIDIKHARKKKIDVLNTPGANANAVAEEVVALMLADARHIVAGDVTTRAGKWEKKKFMGREITGKTIGIVGLGNIGQLVARRLAGFDVKLLGFDPMISQERSFERVGGDTTITVNVRLIAATSKNLEEAIQQKKFREDLYYRLNVFPIHLPPLRERRSDIILLADHFLQKYNALHKKNIKRISTPAINMMMMYHWPGNVRELENCIERAVLTATDDVIHGYSLPPSLQTSEATHTEILPAERISLKTMMQSYERELIVDALKKFSGNATGVAKHLCSTKRIINYKIKQLKIVPGHYRR